MSNFAECVWNAHSLDVVSRTQCKSPEEWSMHSSVQTTSPMQQPMRMWLWALFIEPRQNGLAFDALAIYFPAHEYTRALAHISWMRFALFLAIFSIIPFYYFFFSVLPKKRNIANVFDARNTAKCAQKLTKTKKAYAHTLQIRWKHKISVRRSDFQYEITRLCTRFHKQHQPKEQIKIRRSTSTSTFFFEPATIIKIACIICFQIIFRRFFLWLHF